MSKYKLMQKQQKVINERKFGKFEFISKFTLD